MMDLQAMSRVEIEAINVRMILWREGQAGEQKPPPADPPVSQEGEPHQMELL